MVRPDMTDLSPAWLAAPSADDVIERLAAVRARIEAAGRDPLDVTVIGVTKGFAPGAVTAARAAGIDDIGENYPSEFLAKAAALELSPGGDAPRWHFLGAIQRRRVRSLAPVVGCWQTVSRRVEGDTIARWAPGARVLVEVDTTGLPGRNGCLPAEVPSLVAQLSALGLAVTGLMAIGPPGPAQDARRGFALTAQLAADLGLSELSMGMSNDLEIAVAEGATMVRIGRALFGDRGTPSH